MAAADPTRVRKTPAERGKALAVLNRLIRRYPEIGTALHYSDPWQLLVATVLSAQTTDEVVNRITPALFRRYPAPTDLAEANPEEVEGLVYSTGYYRQKAAAIIGLAGDVVDRYAGVVPEELDQLVTLQGVGRKTASVVLVEAWGKPAIAVDTHVKRVSRRLGLSRHTDAVEIEQDLRSLYPENSWAKVSMRFIQFGRETCVARSPRCDDCELFALCEWPDKRR